jgi:hypothetical protein
MRPTRREDYWMISDQVKVIGGQNTVFFGHPSPTSRMGALINHPKG